MDQRRGQWLGKEFFASNLDASRSAHRVPAAGHAGEPLARTTLSHRLASALYAPGTLNVEELKFCGRGRTLENQEASPGMLAAMLFNYGNGNSALISRRKYTTEEVA